MCVDQSSMNAVVATQDAFTMLFMIELRMGEC
jgi:hypothetical protein